MFLRIIYDETCKGPMYHELKSFFRDSWTQVPDRTSESRSMRPRTVVKLQENKADGRLDNVKKGEEKNSKGDKKMTSEEETDGGGERSGCKDDEAESEQGGQTKNKADFTVASATYVSPRQDQLYSSTLIYHARCLTFTSQPGIGQTRRSSMT